MRAKRKRVKPVSGPPYESCGNCANGWICGTERRRGQSFIAADPVLVLAIMASPMRREGREVTWKGWEEFVPSQQRPMVAGDTLRRQSPPKRSKYGAVKTTVDGVTFDSKKEAARYGELKLLEAAGEIWDLDLQPKFPLLVPSTTGTVMGAAKALAGTFDGRLGEYRGDFRYWDKAGLVVEDVKGMDTPLSKWKRRHVAAQYGIQIRII